MRAPLFLLGVAWTYAIKGSVGAIFSGDLTLALVGATACVAVTLIIDYAVTELNDV